MHCLLNYSPFGLVESEPIPGALYVVFSSKPEEAVESHNDLEYIIQMIMTSKKLPLVINDIPEKKKYPQQKATKRFISIKTRTSTRGRNCGESRGDPEYEATLTENLTLSSHSRPLQSV